MSDEKEVVEIDAKKTLLLQKTFNEKSTALIKKLNTKINLLPTENVKDALLNKKLFNHIQAKEYSYFKLYQAMLSLAKTLPNTVNRNSKSYFWDAKRTKIIKIMDILDRVAEGTVLEEDLLGIEGYFKAEQANSHTRNKGFAFGLLSFGVAFFAIIAAPLILLAPLVLVVVAMAVALVGSALLAFLAVNRLRESGRNALVSEEGLEKVYAEMKECSGNGHTFFPKKDDISSDSQTIVNTLDPTAENGESIMSKSVFPSKPAVNSGSPPSVSTGTPTPTLRNQAEDNKQ